MKKTRRLATTVLCAAILLLARCTFADGPAGTSKPPASIQAANLADGKVTFTWEQLADGTAQITLLNTSKVKHTLIFSGWFSASSSSDPSTTIALKVSPEKPEIESGRYQRLFMSLADPPAIRPRPGTYFAALTFVTEVAQDPPVTIQASITVSDPRPGIDKISVLATRSGPWAGPWSTKFTIPLATSLDTSLLPQDKRTVGYLHRDPEGWVRVQWDEVGNDKAPPTATLEVVDLTAAGKYEGDINLPGVATKASQATLTVVVQDCIFWPVAVIVMGILVAWLAKWYLGVGRNLLKLRQQSKELSNELQNANNAYQSVQGNVPKPPYSIDASLQSQKTQIDSLRKKSFTLASSLDGNTSYKAAKDDLASLEAQLAQFPDLARVGTKLSDLIASVEPLANQGMSVGNMQTSPTLLVNARCLLAGRPIDTADIPQLIQTMIDSYTTLQAWTSVLEHTITLTQDYDQCLNLEGLSDTEKATLGLDEKPLLRLWDRLWSATTGDAVVALSAVGSDLESISVDLEQIKAHRRRTESVAGPQAAFTNFAQQRAKVLAMFNQSAPVTGLSVAQDQRQVRLLGVAIAVGDFGSIVLALFIAIITGLNYSYWGKPFGTIQDYAVLFLWAAGTKVGVDIVTAITDRLASYL
jgi:hypothetical protein